MIRLACMVTDRRSVFTPVELEIVSLIGAGKTPKQIAAQRHCSESTISQTLKSARALARVQTNSELVATAIRKGWIS